MLCDASHQKLPDALATVQRINKYVCEPAKRPGVRHYTRASDLQRPEMFRVYAENNMGIGKGKTNVVEAAVIGPIRSFQVVVNTFQVYAITGSPFRTPSTANLTAAMPPGSTVHSLHSIFWSVYQGSIR